MWQSLLCLLLTCNKQDTNILRDQDVVVTAVTNEPYIFKKPNYEQLVGNDRYQGFLVDLLEAVSDELGTHFIIKDTRDGRYGQSFGNGNWSGMVGEVKRGEADMAVADLTLAPNRVLEVDFTLPFMETGLVPLVYSNDATAEMTSLENLREKGIELMTVAGGSTHNFFKNSLDPFYSSLASSMSFCSNSRDCVQKVLAAEGKVATMMELQGAKFFAGKDCRLRIVGEPINSLSYGFVLAKGAAVKVGSDTYDYRTPFNWAISSIKSSGQMKRIEQKWWKVSDC